MKKKRNAKDRSMTTNRMFFQRGDAVPLTAAYCLSSKEKKEKYTELLDIAKGM